VTDFKRKLREFIESDIRTIDYVKHQLESVFGTLYRVGGEQRVYDIDGTNQKAAVYVVGNTHHGIGLGYTSNKIQSIYWWNVFSIEHEPDYALDIPSHGSFSDMLPTISSMIQNQTTGKVDINA
jgi:hypothetical protein